MYQIPGLLKYPNLFHVFSTKKDGNMANVINGKLCNFDKVLIKRQRFLSKVGVDMDKCVCMSVNHKDGIIEADSSSAKVSMLDYKKTVKTDGLICDKKKLYLFLLIADCLPIIIYDPKREVIGLVHAGWKGLDKEIAEKAVKQLNDTYKSEPKDLIVAIGPFVHKSSFVKVNPSQKDDLKWKPFIKRVGLRGDFSYSVALFGLTKKQLLDAGVMDKNIIESRVDTAKDERFFSHVRDRNLPIGEQGRFACVLGLIK